MILELIGDVGVVLLILALTFVCIIRHSNETP